MSHNESAAAELPRSSGLRIPLVSPSVAVLLIWMIIPLGMTLWFSFQRYSLLSPDSRAFSGLTTSDACRGV